MQEVRCPRIVASSELLAEMMPSKNGFRHGMHLPPKSTLETQQRVLAKRMGRRGITDPPMITVRLLVFVAVICHMLVAHLPSRILTQIVLHFHISILEFGLKSSLCETNPFAS